MDTDIFSGKMRMNPTYDAYEEDIGLINVYFADDKIPFYISSNKMSIFDFFYQIGGSLGFIMGISMVSIIEIIYWFVIHLCKFIDSSKVLRPLN